MPVPFFVYTVLYPALISLYPADFLPHKKNEIMKRNQIKRRPLADTTLQKLEPEAVDYRELDGDGLYFRVKTNGSKSWNLRYKRPNGKWAWLGLGRYPEVSGKSAREEAERLRKLASNGADLKILRDGERARPLFRVVAEDWYDRKVAEGLAPKTLRLMRDALDKDILPAIGDTSLEKVTRADCTKLQSDIEDREAWEIAKKVRGWLGEMFSLSIAQGKCDLNPASELRHVARRAPATQHHPHLHEPELPAFLKALSRSNSMYPTRVAVYMILLTASRPGMVRLAEWDELDMKGQLWTIPGAKMKKGRDHLVPLPDQMMPMLENLKEITGRGRYLFPGVKTNAVLSHTTVNTMLAQAGYKGKLTGHGSRHTASTLLNEHGWRHTYVDMQLSHKMPGVRGVYNKAMYLEQRRTMMQWYSDYLDALQAGMKEEQKEAFKARVLA